MRALLLDPALILLDQPLGALDPMIRSELQRDLRRASLPSRNLAVHNGGRGRGTAAR
jgi:ABC-type proline/glycine betaine transport system ATPase subunit